MDDRHVTMNDQGRNPQGLISRQLCEIAR